MIRAIGFTLALTAGTATAGELVDCYNDEIDPEARHTSIEPEVLRVTDADIALMLERIRENENRSIAGAEAEPALRVTLRGETTASD